MDRYRLLFYVLLCLSLLLNVIVNCDESEDEGEEEEEEEEEDNGYSLPIYDPRRKWNTRPGQPGIKLRFDENAVREIQDTVFPVLFDQLEKLKVKEIDLSRPGVSIKLTNVRMAKFDRPKKSLVKLIPPDMIGIGIQNTNAVIKAGIQLGQADSNGVGEVEATIDGLTILAYLAAKNSKGNTRISVRKCEAPVTNASAVINSENIFVQELAKQFQSEIDDVFKKTVPNAICGAVGGLASRALVDILKDAALIIPLDMLDTGEFGEELPPGVETVDNIQGNLILDNDLMGRMKVSRTAVMTSHRGEIRYRQSQLRTPFYPDKVRDAPQSDGRMVYVTVTQYVVQSMMYHTATKSKLQVSVQDGDLPVEYADLLKTSCEEFENAGAENDLAGIDDDGKLDKDDLEEFKESCLGLIIPELDRDYPNRAVRVQMTPWGVPYFEIANGAGKMKAIGQLELQVSRKPISRAEKRQRKKFGYVRNTSKKTKRGKRSDWIGVLIGEVMIDTDIPFELKGTKIVGDPVIRHLTMKVTKRRRLKGMEADLLESLVPVLKDLMQDAFKDQMTTGFELPGQEFMTLIEPKLFKGDGFIQVAFDFTLKEGRIEYLIDAGIDSLKDALSNFVE